MAIDTAIILRLSGLSVYFFSGVGPEDHRLHDAGVHCICLRQHDILTNPARGRAAIDGLWNATAARALRDLLSRLDPRTSIVHVHGWAKCLSPSIGPVVTSGRIPAVYTMHEYFLACPNGGFYDYRRREICTRRPLGASCLRCNCDPRSRSHKWWRIGRQAVLWSAGAMPRKLQDVVYLSSTQIDAMRRYLPVGSRLHHLPNPVERTMSERAAAEESDLFLFVGRLSGEKGGEIAAAAARMAGVRIGFAGDGEQRDAITAANSNAEMYGWVARDALVELIRRARCVVFPSLWYEGLPMTVIEAMQHGVPVLVSDRSAATEIVRHDVDGRHVACGDVADWAAAMRLCLDRDTVARYSQLSFRASKDFLDPEDYRARLVQIYDQASRLQAG